LLAHKALLVLLVLKEVLLVPKAPQGPQDLGLLFREAIHTKTLSLSTTLRLETCGSSQTLALVGLKEMGLFMMVRIGTT
jgi:hypothetical protein